MVRGEGGGKGGVGEGRMEVGGVEVEVVRRVEVVRGGGGEGRGCR